MLTTSRSGTGQAATLRSVYVSGGTDDKLDKQQKASVISDSDAMKEINRGLW